MRQDLPAYLRYYFEGKGIFKGLGLPSLSQNYTWPKKGLFPNIASVIGKDLSVSGSNYERNARLKRESEALWAEFGGVELARWIVSDWGGIRSNKERTLSRYVERIAVGDIPTELTGVASYSKILSFMAPTKYAIYDARVAISLNAIQLLTVQTNGVAFRYLPGRNKALQKFRDDPSTSYTALIARGWRKLEQDETYATYLQVLRSVSSDFNDLPLYELEMSLFADAESLADLYLTKLNA